MTAKAPKDSSCYSLPTVKKLLEQKRKRETVTSSSSVVSAPCVTTPGSASSTPASRHTAADVSEPMGAVGPMPVSTYIWETSGPPGDPVFPAQGGYFTNAAALLDCSHNLTFNTDPVVCEQPQEYSGAMRIHHYSSLVQHGAEPSPSFSWSALSNLQTQEHPTHSYNTEMDAAKLEEARLFLHAMDYSKKVWQDEDGDTILHIYVAKGLREFAFAAAEDLCELGKLDSREHKGKSALLVAVTANQPLIVQDLLTLGADVNACDDKGQTALHLAATYAFPRVLQTILTLRFNFSLESRNFEGLTALHCAALSHSASVKHSFAGSDLHQRADDALSCIQLLLNNGASLLSQDIKSNKTVLHLAVKEGNIQLVRFLLKINLPDMQAFINMKAHGNTALHMAAGLHSSFHQEEVIRLLLSRGADPGVRNLENEQPAHLLQAGERGEQLKFLLKKRNGACRRRVASLQEHE